MRITDTPKIGGLVAAGSTQRASGTQSRFSLGSPEATQRAGGMQATAPAAAMDGLLALQAAGDVIERRKRLMRRGRGLLDTLDQLKISLLGGQVSGATLSMLKGQLAQARDGADDPALDDLLAHIDLRAEVELAKLARR